MRSDYQNMSTFDKNEHYFNNLKVLVGLQYETIEMYTSPD